MTECLATTGTPRPRRLTASLLAIVCVLGAASGALAQLTPERAYYGVKQPVPMKVTIPSGAAGDAEIQLLSPGSADVVEKAAAAAGPVDLAATFPQLWTTAQPRLLYAQLVVGGKKIGPGVVLQPMLTPRYASMPDRANRPMFPSESTWERIKVYSGLRAYVDKHVVLETSKGDIEIALRPDVAPNTVWNFRELVQNGFYTNIVIHRIDNRGEGFVIQFGDPVANGTGGPGYFIDLEPSTLPHDFGVLSMARSSDPNTGSSQVFLCLSRNGTQALDGLYTSFGETVKGGDVIAALAATPVKPVEKQGDPPDKPIDPPMIKSAKLVDAPPYGEGPKPVKKGEPVGGAR